MLGLILLSAILALFGYYIYKKGYENEDYFSSRGIKSLKPTFLLGNLTDVMMRRKNLLESVRFVYDSVPNERVIGILDFRSPVLVLKDPELVKQFVVKDFNNFTDHKVVITEDMDALLGNSLISLTGDKWRDMRSTLSPAFTGSKMRQMFDLMVDICEQVVVYLRAETKTKDLVEYDMKQLCSKFTNDIIAVCAFGIKVDSFADENSEFLRTGKDVLNFAKPSRIWRFFGFRILPKLMTFFKVELLEEKSKNFFRTIVLNSMNYREKNKIFRPDMINLLMDARKGALSHKSSNEDKEDNAGFATAQESEMGKMVNKRKWTDDEIVAQCFLFFLAGLDTSSTVMTLAAYELTVNPDIQDKLYQEIQDVNDKLEGKKLTYDVLQKMKYLDMFVSEVLRKWPPAPVTDRFCTKDMDFNDEKGFSFKFAKGMSIWIPIVAFHYDEKYFPNPEKFDPERFSDENKHLINPDAYMPFGVGPRNCIGSRFALMEVKALFYFLILNFTFHITEKTVVPLRIIPSFGGLLADTKIEVGLKSRH